MREQYVRILVPNYNPDPLSVKQFFQMQSFAKDVQTYLPYQSTTLLDFMSIAYNYCLKTRQNSLDNMACYRDDFRHKVMLFLTKYYPNGFKKNKKGLSDINPAKRNVMVVKNEMRLLKQKRNVLQI